MTDSDQNSKSKPTYLSIHDNLTSEQMVTENNATVFSKRDAFITLLFVSFSCDNCPKIHKVQHFMTIPYYQYFYVENKMEWAKNTH